MIYYKKLCRFVIQISQALHNAILILVCVKIFWDYSLSFNTFFFFFYFRTYLKSGEFEGQELGQG